MHNLIKEIKSENDDIEINEEELITIFDKTQNENISWIIRFFAGFGAWISMLTFMGFLALAELFESGEATLLVGIIFLAISLVLSNKINAHLFLEPLILALGMIGQGSIIGGSIILFDNFKGSDLTVIYVILLMMASIVFFFTKSHTQAFLSVISFCFAILGLCFQIDLFNFIHLFIGVFVFVFSALLLWENKVFILLSKFLNFYNTIILALVISITGLLATYSFASTNKYSLLDKEWGAFIEGSWISSMLIIACSIFVIYHLLKELTLDKNHFIFFFACLSLLLSLTFFISAGISWSFLVILLGVFRSQRIIIGIGIISFLYFLGLFYYGLHMTFLMKSITLIGSGFLFITIGILIRLKFLKHDEK